MSMTLPARPLAAAAALLLAAALAGCGADTTPTDIDPRSDDASGSGTGDASGSPTACVIGTWNADVDGLVTQLGAQLQENGLDVVTTRATGEQTLHLTEDGGFRFSNDVAFAVDVQMGDGPAMTVAQSHVGDSTATWAWDASAADPAMMFEGYDDSAYTIENTVSIGGVAATTPIELPPVGSTGGRLLVSCDGDRMETKWTDGPFTTTWSR